MNAQPTVGKPSPRGTLLLRLAGPMQSWGIQSRFTIRDSGLEPSKSGVIGLLCAALGRPRTTSLTDLAALRMGVRVDREGILTYDFHTAQNVLKASGELKETELSRRYYLADASFLVGLYGEEVLLHRLHEVLRKPIWPLFLGRKAFVPGESIWLTDGLHPGTALRAAVTTYPWLARPGQNPPKRLRLVLEDPEGSEVRSDQPVSFQTDARRYAPRRVQTDWVFLSQ